MSDAVQLWQLVRIRGRVEEMAGGLDIMIYRENDTKFRIWYNPADDVALYARVVWNEQLQRPKLEKAFPHDVLAALNSEETKVNVDCKDGRESEWFGTDHDMRPIGELYSYVMSFDPSVKHEKV
jgi:hypothetical protein